MSTGSYYSSICGGYTLSRDWAGSSNSCIRTWTSHVLECFGASTYLCDSTSWYGNLLIPACVGNNMFNSLYRAGFSCTDFGFAFSISMLYIGASLSYVLFISWTIL